MCLRTACAIIKLLFLLSLDILRLVLQLQFVIGTNDEWQESRRKTEEAAAYDKEFGFLVEQIDLLSKFVSEVYRKIPLDLMLRVEANYFQKYGKLPFMLQKPNNWTLQE